MLPLKNYVGRNNEQVKKSVVAFPNVGGRLSG